MAVLGPRLLGRALVSLMSSDNRVYLLNSVGKDQDGKLCAAPRIRKGSGPPALWEVIQEVSRALGKHCLGLGN